MDSGPSKGAGVRAVLRALARQREYGDTGGGWITALERAIDQGLVSFEEGEFVLTPSGRQRAKDDHT